MKGESSVEAWTGGGVGGVEGVGGKEGEAETEKECPTSSLANICMILLPWLWMFSKIITEGCLEESGIPIGGRVILERNRSMNRN